ncbi:MAG: hypothetical protein K6F86_07760 [Lachnospiraceae bacterium]|nr:hypothetical protein [Lachnospiraceae bacterium]
MDIGYRDYYAEIEDVERAMYKAALEGRIVTVTCHDGKRIAGKASDFVAGNNEEDGYARFSIDGTRLV